MARVAAELREHILAFWRGHSEAWQLSGVTQREYCEQQGVSLKNFGNWRAQLKRIAIAGADARWGHYPRLRHMASPMANPGAGHMAKKRAVAPLPASAPAPVPAAGARRQFSEEAKQRIVAETCRPGASVSAVARRYGIDLRLLFRWRRAFEAEPLPERLEFVSVEVGDGNEPPLVVNPCDGGLP
jgi:transposase-like protein